MKYRYFGKQIDPSCKYCRLGTQSMDSSFVICSKRGAVNTFFYCKRFCYDPLKRVPQKNLKIKRLDKSDFEL